MAEMPDNKFQFHLFMDQGITGNYEITVFDNVELKGEGKLVYSKQKSGKFPHVDAEEFEKLTKSLTEATC